MHRMSKGRWEHRLKGITLNNTDWFTTKEVVLKGHEDASVIGTLKYIKNVGRRPGYYTARVCMFKGAAAGEASDDAAGTAILNAIEDHRENIVRQFDKWLHEAQCGAEPAAEAREKLQENTGETQGVPPEVVEMLQDYKRLLLAEEKYIIELAAGMDPADTLAEHYTAKLFMVDQVLKETADGNRKG